MAFESLIHPGVSIARKLLSELTWNYAVSHSSETHLSHSGEFDMDPSTGFMPSIPPLARLPADFDLWEDALASAPKVLSVGEDESDESKEAVARRDRTRRWRSGLRNAPVLPTDALHDDVRCLRRAHHVLAFLVHFYMNSMPPPTRSQRLAVPASLAIPLVTVSDVLGIAPILTFADTVLWNWTLVNPRKPLSPENLRPQTLFTGGRDEQNFYICCASIELRGVEALRLINDYNGLSSTEDPHVIDHIAESLRRLSVVVDQLTTTLMSVRATCDPHAFYFQIRPWFRGSDADGPDSPAWVYEGVDPFRKLELSGPSAGQSSTMHALDVFLDIDHTLSETRSPPPSEQNLRADHAFMKRMRKYMPGKHQEFLLHLASKEPRIRKLAQCNPTTLQEPYNSVVLALKAFRDQHLRIACLYVVSMSHSAAVVKSGCPVAAMMEKLQREGAVRRPVRGTGGNELSCLLKATRDATWRTVLRGNIN